MEGVQPQRHRLGAPALLGAHLTTGSRLNTWGASTYGDPCRVCGFHWSTSLGAARDVVAGIPASFREVLVGASGSERRPDLEWSVGSYVCHVADNLRIWAERLAGVAAGGPREVPGYDQDDLARARRYSGISLAAATWSLDRSVGDWLWAVDRSAQAGPIMHHPERGELDLRDIAVSNAHDTVHHLHDIETILASVGT